jgi:hypothetical protein
VVQVLLPVKRKEMCIFVNGAIACDPGSHMVSSQCRHELTKHAFVGVSIFSTWGTMAFHGNWHVACHFLTKRFILQF